jgi:thioredoxin reductase
VCPEGDVLAVVGGTATVVNGLKCVGHGECAQYCPVGAIEVSLGDLKSRNDIPLMDEWHETNVPGLFVAGELGGLALIRNAVAQGQRVVERIEQKIRTAGSRQGDEVVDVLVVGAGPAGIAAAATAVSRGLSHVVLEKEQGLGGSILHYPRRKLVLVQPLELPLWGRMEKDEYGKERILEILEDLTRRFRLNIRYGEKVVDVKKENAAFEVRTPERVHRSRSVVLALGRRGTPRKLGVPGEELPKVMYKLLDAESYRGQRILVVGGGDSAAEAAYGLAQQPGNKVTLSYRREKFVRIKRKNEERIGEAIRREQVQALFNSQVTEILPDKAGLRLKDKPIEIPNDYVFVFAGGEPPFPFLRQIGVKFGGDSSANKPSDSSAKGRGGSLPPASRSLKRGPPEASPRTEPREQLGARER